LPEPEQRGPERLERQGSPERSRAGLLQAVMLVQSTQAAKLARTPSALVLSLSKNSVISANM